MAGGGKQTPRQAMIGMMYLVLTCLLAMNVSKDILNGFVMVNSSLERTNNNFGENTKRVMEGFKKAIESSPGAKPYYEKAIEIRKITDELDAHIEKLKNKVIFVVEGPESEAMADTMQLKYCQAKDNYDKPTYLMIGAEPATPSDGEFTAVDLRKRIMKAHDSYVKIFDDLQKGQNKLLKEDYESVKKKIEAIKPEDPKEKEDDVPVTWELLNFYHLPLAAVLTNLSKIQSDVKNVEAELIAQLSGALGKTSFKFDKLSAKVIAPSSYIQAGQDYTADIFLAASSNAFSSENMQILMGAAYDSINKKLLSEGSALPNLSGGIGTYTQKTGGAGEQKFGGVIKLKNPKGDFEYYPFQQSYMVAPPSVAVEPEKMNVFYIGVPNPIAVSAAGVAPSELVVNVSGGGAKLISKGPGQFDVVCTSPGECNISVSQKTASGTKPQGPPKKFRVKKIPDPVAAVAGKKGTTDIKKIEVGGIGGVQALLEGFDFQANFLVVSYELTAIIKGSPYVATGQGPGLTSEMKAKLGQITTGGKIFIDNVKAKGPDGTIRSIPGVTLKVKN